MILFAYPKPTAFSTWDWLFSSSLCDRTARPCRLCSRRQTRTMTDVLSSTTQMRISRGCTAPGRCLRASIYRSSVCTATNSCSNKRSKKRDRRINHHFLTRLISSLLVVRFPHFDVKKVLFIKVIRNHVTLDTQPCLGLLPLFPRFLH